MKQKKTKTLTFRCTPNLHDDIKLLCVALSMTADELLSEAASVMHSRTMVIKKPTFGEYGYRDGCDTSPENKSPARVVVSASVAPWIKAELEKRAKEAKLTVSHFLTCFLADHLRILEFTPANGGKRSPK